MLTIRRCISCSAKLSGRKTNEIYDRRIFPITGKHVNAKTPGGWAEFPKIADELNPFRVAPTGYEDEKGRFHLIKELVPELVVPDLEGFDLKPYVSYRVKNFSQSEFTAAHLFEACLASDIREDFNHGKLQKETEQLEGKRPIADEVDKK